MTVQQYDTFLRQPKSLFSALPGLCKHSLKRALIFYAIAYPNLRRHCLHCRPVHLSRRRGRAVRSSRPRTPRATLCWIGWLESCVPLRSVFFPFLLREWRLPVGSHTMPSSSSSTTPALHQRLSTRRREQEPLESLPFFLVGVAWISWDLSRGQGTLGEEVLWSIEKFRAALQRADRLATAEDNCRCTRRHPV